MARELLALEATQQIRTFIAAARATSLAALGLKVVDLGEFRPIAKLRDVLSQVVVQFVQSESDYRRDRESLSVEHSINVYLFRLLGDTESKNVAVLADASKIHDLFCQGDFLEPFRAGWVHPSAMPLYCYPTSLRLDEGFAFEDGCEIEVATIALKVGFEIFD